MGGHTILIDKGGAFIINANGSLSIENCSIIIERDITSSNKSIFSFFGKKFNLSNCSILFKSKLIIQTDYDTSALTQLIYANSDVYKEINFLNNVFYSDLPFSSALLNGSCLKGNIKNNVIEDFHGVFKALNSEYLTISRNVLKKNSFYNIFCSGAFLNIENNIIESSGRGMTGDSITLGKIDNSKVSFNMILKSGCYGIQFLSDVNSVSVAKNSFFKCLTNCIYFAPISTSNKFLRDILIEKNIFLDNIGFAIAIMNNNIINISIINNILYKNSKNFCKPIFFDKKINSAKIFVKNNETDGEETDIIYSI